MFLLVDEYGRVMWGNLLKSKDEAFEAFKKFRAQVESEDERKVKTFRTDRDGEFMSKQFIAYCEDVGITRHFTAPYSPQQNGVVERRNRTVLEMARSFLKGMQIPLMLWGEAIRHSIYVLNRLPKRAITGMTPFEAWSGMKPDIGHIKVFGCLAHMKLPSVHTTKLDDRSKLVINLGKEPGSKAYRLYDPEQNTVHVSRDVVFEENKSWPWENDKERNEEDRDTFVVTEAVTRLEGIYYNGEESPNLTFEGSTFSETGSVHTPNSAAANSASSVSADVDTGSGPRRYRPLNEIYVETQEIELDDEELMLA